MLRTTCAAAILTLGCAIGLSGCATRPPGERLDANVPAPQLRENLKRNFPPGMTEQQVRAELDRLDVSSKYRMDYPKTEARPHVLLVRLYEPGGFWLDDDDIEVNWSDVSFVFGQDGKLEKTLVFEDGNRYLRGLPINPPKREMAGRMERYPAPPPPPVDPLQGAE